METTTDFAFRRKTLRKEFKIEESSSKIRYAPLALGTNTRYKLIANPSYLIPKLVGTTQI